MNSSADRPSMPFAKQNSVLTSEQTWQCKPTSSFNNVPDAAKATQKTQGKSNSFKTTKNCLRGTLSLQKFMQSSLSKWKDFSCFFLSVVVFSCQNAAALSFSATYSFLLCKRCNIHLRPVNGNGPHLRSPFFKNFYSSSFLESDKLAMWLRLRPSCAFSAVMVLAVIIVCSKS